MIALVVVLGVALVLALLVVAHLVVSLPRRLVRLTLDQWIATEAARNEKAALKQGVAVEVAAALRDLHAYRMEADRILSTLRALCEWLAAFASAVHAQAQSAVAETARKPEVLPVSRERLATEATAPAIAPPGSAPQMPSGPAQVAAGLGPRPAPKAPVVPRPRPPLGSAPTLPSMQAPKPEARAEREEGS